MEDFCQLVDFYVVMMTSQEQGKICKPTAVQGYYCIGKSRSANVRSYMAKVDRQKWSQQQSELIQRGEEEGEEEL